MCALITGHGSRSSGDAERERRYREEGEDSEDPPRMSELLDAPREEMLDRSRHPAAQQSVTEECSGSSGETTYNTERSAQTRQVSKRRAGESGDAQAKVDTHRRTAAMR